MALCRMQEGSIWVTKCCYSYNSMCSCTLGCMPVCWTLFHSHERSVGLCLQLVFRSTCRALAWACPNTGTLCFRTFGPGTRTWPVFAQGGGGYPSRRQDASPVDPTVCPCRTGGSLAVTRWTRGCCFGRDLCRPTPPSLPRGGSEELSGSVNRKVRRMPCHIFVRIAMPSPTVRCRWPWSGCAPCITRAFGTDANRRARRRAWSRLDVAPHFQDWFTGAEKLIGVAETPWLELLRSRWTVATVDTTKAKRGTSPLPGRGVSPCKLLNKSPARSPVRGRSPSLSLPSGSPLNNKSPRSGWVGGGDEPPAPSVRLGLAKEELKQKTVFVVRHGQSTWNKAQADRDVVAMFSDTDHPLNDVGVYQAEALQVRLRAGSPVGAVAPALGCPDEPPLFFLLRTAPRDRQRPTANRHQPPTAIRHQPPTAIRHQPPSATNRHPPPTANRQPSPTANYCSIRFLWFCGMPMS